MNNERRIPFLLILGLDAKVNFGTLSVKLLGTIQTSFVQSLSNSTHKLLMIRGGVLLILGHLVKG